VNVPFPYLNNFEIYILKNFFLPYPASPINPEVRRSILAGSGTADTAMFGPKIPSVGIMNQWMKWKEK
jgi:hypothetical protein